MMQIHEITSAIPVTVECCINPFSAGNSALSRPRSLQVTFGTRIQAWIQSVVHHLHQLASGPEGINEHWNSTGYTGPYEDEGPNSEYKRMSNL